MAKRILLVGAGLALLLPLVTAFVLAPGDAAPAPPAPAVPAAAEQAALIDALRPPKRARPVVAIAALNDATEVADLLVAYGVLARADVAEVAVVAAHDAPVRLYPSLGASPHLTFDAFDRRHPEGADYVVVPAMEPVDDPVVAAWIARQYADGATIVSICNGSRVLAAAGLLDGRRGTGHWSAIAELRERHPGFTWVPDRRYVADQRVVTSTGITSGLPLMLAMVEAIGGRERAASVAADLGLAHWDARHDSAAFALTGERRKTFVRNTVAVWRHETVGVPVEAGVDEVALGLTVDANARTALAKVVGVGVGGPVRSRHGLTIHPDGTDPGRVDLMLPPPAAHAPALALERELGRIATRYDAHTADIVALVMEYPWHARPAGDAGPAGR